MLVPISGSTAMEELTWRVSINFQVLGMFCLFNTNTKSIWYLSLCQCFGKHFRDTFPIMMAERTIVYTDVPPTNKRNKLLEVEDGDQSAISVGAAFILKLVKIS